MGKRLLGVLSWEYIEAAVSAPEICRKLLKVEFIHNQRTSHDQRDNIQNKKFFTKFNSLRHTDALYTKCFSGKCFKLASAESEIVNFM